MTENTAEKKVLAEAAEIFPGEDTADLKRLFSGSLPAAETADKDEEVPALNIAEINKDLGCLSEALSRMSLDELQETVLDGCRKCALVIMIMISVGVQTPGTMGTRTQRSYSTPSTARTARMRSRCATMLPRPS